MKQLLSLIVLAVAVLVASPASAVTQQDVDNKRASAVQGKNNAVNVAESASSKIAGCQSLIDDIEYLGAQLVYDGCLNEYQVPQGFYTTLQGHETTYGQGNSQLAEGDSDFEEGENETTLQAQYDKYGEAELHYGAALNKYLWITSIAANPNGHIGLLEADLQAELTRLEQIQQNCQE